MNKRVLPVIVGVAVLGAGAFALLSGEQAPAAVHATSASADTQAPPAFDTTQLPPNHPPIGGHGGAGAIHPSANESPTLTWASPSAWQVMPNPNAVRLATYRVPGDAEVSVSRAGGTVDANIQRWTSQFDDGAPSKRTTRKVRGLDATIFEVTGTYTGSPTMGAPSVPHAGWTLVAAVVVPAEGSPYFFKLLGPSAAVRDARAAFDSMIDGISPR